ncbi:MAG: transposase, partial [Candidatus Rokubacteria bacterium]|nr:transposase [Candidatus Rokubacteria bacterium]
MEGFDLHANLSVPAEDRARLEQLCRYLLRPPVAQDRLRLTGDGRILLEFKSAWHDGTSHLLFDPLELLEKLGMRANDEVVNAKGVEQREQFAEVSRHLHAAVSSSAQPRRHAPRGFWIASRRDCPGLLRTLAAFSFGPPSPSW